MEGFLHMKNNDMKKKLLPIAVIVGLIIIVAAIIAITALVKKYTPSKERQNLDEYYGIQENSQVAIILNNEKSDSYATLIDGKIYLDYNFLHDNIDARYYWDANENILLYAKPDKIISAEAESNSYSITKAATDFGYPIVKATSDSAYVALDFVTMFSNVKYDFYDEPNRIVVTSQWGQVDSASMDSDTAVRVKGGIKSPILEDISEGDSVVVLDQGDDWSKISTSRGFIGYVKNNTLSDVKSETLTNEDYEEETYSHILLDKTVCMAWHQVTNTSSNANVSSVLAKGINVISPTWFSLKDNQGNISDIASKDYVSYCRSHGVQVWALFSNLENSDVDSTYVLTHTSTRTNLVNQIIAAAIKYELDGVNIDFESLNGSEVGDSYIEFIRELSIKCKNNGIILSVDNYVPSSYTAFYNRAEQAKFADYVVIMGYDEHYAGSESGSVASLGWVKEGVDNTLKSVPANQVILGMPLYTRIWELTPKGEDTATENSSESDLYDVSSTVYGMNGAVKQVNNNGAVITWDEESGQNYAEWTANDKLYKVWLEDSSSIEERLKVISENSLAGGSFWKLGFETDSIWDTVIKYLN